jgi:hypothetical protein
VILALGNRIGDLLPFIGNIYGYMCMYICVFDQILLTLGNRIGDLLPLIGNINIFSVCKQGVLVTRHH